MSGADVNLLSILRADLKNGADAPTTRATVPRPEGAPPDPWQSDVFLTLTPKQQAFTRMYLTDARGNASEAVRLAGMDVKSVRATAHQILKTPKVQKAIEALTAQVRAWELWQIHSTAPEVIVRGEVRPPTAGPPPPMTKKRLLAIMAAMAEGRDPRWDLGGTEPSFPIVLRAQDMVAAGKLVAELRGWRRSTTVLEGNPKKPLLSVTADLKRLSHDEVRARLQELRERKAQRLALVAPKELPAAPEKEAA